MSDRKAERPEEESIASADPEVTDEAESAEAAPQDAVDPADVAADLAAEVTSLKDQLLRALAETENVRRRGQRERADTAKYAAGPLVKDLVEVADNLRRAIEAVPAEAVEADPHLKTLMTGVELTEKALQGVFEKHDIVKIDPLGERLDPNYHEAMFEIPDPDAASGTVVQVVRSGYRLHDRLLRAAQVGVARGGPSPAPPQAPKAATDEGAGDSGETQEPEPEAQSTPGSRIDTTA